jgi:6-phosphogluconate dehydrogenase
VQCKIGVVGLGVMGSSLARNFERNGFPVAGYDLDAEKTRAFVQGAAKGKAVVGAASPGALMQALEKPRRVLLMVPAGRPVDSAIAHIKPSLERGDILIDGGNSLFSDTDRRSAELEADGLLYVGMGVSGGEEGALWGPAIMAGGPREAWEKLAPCLRAIAAKAEDGEPCALHMGPRGAGHYVKMVHNGIEYGDMQLIAETYDVLSRGLGLAAAEIAQLFAEWNDGELKSYLVEITAHILSKVDPDTGNPIVDVILDEAQQKGTGKWMSQNAFDVGAPIPTVNAAVESRILSALKGERTAAAKALHGPAARYDGDAKELVRAARGALCASKILSYAQGMAMLRIGSAEYGYDIDLCSVAKVWRAGCIIRASLLGEIMSAFGKKADLENLLFDDALREAVESRQGGLRLLVTAAVAMGIPVAATSASLAYFDAYRSERLPANLTQAQRDYFGAHTYRRTDKPGTFHTKWTP